MPFIYPFLSALAGGEIRRKVEDCFGMGWTSFLGGWILLFDDHSFFQVVNNKISHGFSMFVFSMIRD